jgi:phosphoglucomutase
LNILARRKQSVKDIVTAHWQEYGRNFYTRHDYEEVDASAASNLMMALRDSLPSRIGKNGITTADDFSYNDPIDKSSTSGQGIRLIFEDNSRVIYRLSGTGTAGATLRVYVESYEANASKHDVETQVALKTKIDFANHAAGIEHYTGRSAPTVIT